MVLSYICPSPPPDQRRCLLALASVFSLFRFLWPSAWGCHRKPSPCAFDSFCQVQGESAPFHWRPWKPKNRELKKGAWSQGPSPNLKSFEDSATGWHLDSNSSGPTTSCGAFPQHCKHEQLIICLLSCLFCTPRAGAALGDICRGC